MLNQVQHDNLSFYDIGGSTMKIIIALLLCTNLVLAQQTTKPYEIPFASKGNVIELSVSNSSVLTAEGVKVEVTNVPEGIKFAKKSVTLQVLKSKDEQVASFSFSVEKIATIN
jgi:hypothetical protein